MKNNKYNLIATFLLLISAENLNSIMLYKYNSLLTPSNVKSTYADNNAIVEYVNKDLEGKIPNEKKLIIKFEDKIEKNQLKQIEEEYKEEKHNIDFLKSEIKLKEDLVKRIKNRLKDKYLLTDSYSKEEIEEIETQIYFYQREILRYKIDFDYFNKLFKIIQNKRDQIIKEIENKKIYTNPYDYISEIKVDKDQVVKKMDLLFKTYSLERPYFKIKLDKKTYEDIKDYDLEITVFHREEVIKPIKKEIKKISGNYYIIVTLSEISQYYLKDSFEIIIKKKEKRTMITDKEFEEDPFAEF